MKKWIPASQRQAREVSFLAAFYDSDSPTYEDGKASAVAAGYKEKIASRQAENLLAKYRGCDFQAIAKAMSIDRISLGLRLRNIIQKGAPRDVLSAARLLLANMGEVTDAASTKINISAQQTTVRMIIGGTPEAQAKIDRLCNGYSQAPQLEAENPESGKTAPVENVIDVTADEPPTEDGPSSKPDPGPAAPRDMCPTCGVVFEPGRRRIHGINCDQEPRLRSGGVAAA